MASQAEINAVNEAMRLASENAALAARVAELEDTLRQALDVLWFHDKGLAGSFRKR